MRNTLESLHKSLRRNISVLGVAPGAYIDEKLCNSTRHIACNGDIVPCLDLIGKIACRDTITTVSSPVGSFLEKHSFVNEVYFEPTLRSIENYKKTGEPA